MPKSRVRAACGLAAVISALLWGCAGRIDDHASAPPPPDPWFNLVNTGDPIPANAVIGEVTRPKSSIEHRLVDQPILSVK
jgi:hypothetical protein